MHDYLWQQPVKPLLSNRKYEQIKRYTVLCDFNCGRVRGACRDGITASLLKRWERRLYLVKTEVSQTVSRVMAGCKAPFGHVAGVNLPLAIIRWMCDEKVEESLLTERMGILVHKDIEIVNAQRMDGGGVRLITVSWPYSYRSRLFNCRVYAEEVAA